MVLALGALLAIAAGIVLLLAAAVVALVLAIVAYLFADRVVLRLSHARPASPDDEPRYHNLVEGLCVSAGLPKPELYVIDDDAPNSFATGRSPAHAAIVVTTGLLRKLSRMELEGILAHELSHIRSNDTLLTSLGTALVGLPLLPAGPLSARLLGTLVGRLFGEKVAARVGPVWGFDEEKQELRNMWMRTGQPGLWFIAGSLAQCRIYSKYLALQIKAIEEDLLRQA